MEYEAKNYDNLLGIRGLSDQLLKNHFKLYQGYVENTNKLLKHMSALIRNGDENSPEFAEIKRRFGWEFNGMRLHEYYFENLSKDDNELHRDSDLYKKIEKDFGSFENWQKDFMALGAMRGIGWNILFFDTETDKLLNCWINEHDCGHLCGLKPLFVVDVFEHAYMTEYGLKKNDYLQTIYSSINWNAVTQRFNQYQNGLSKISR